MFEGSSSLTSSKPTNHKLGGTLERNGSSGSKARESMNGRKVSKAYTS
ncbi:hypothetical protein HanIR_Chr10g0468371 [Helianthus annuus]|nr:hypothetical protein HanIR_Chr10g0468371 [Helianthus annuus]